MKNKPPALAPFLRSDLQGRLLARILGAPGAEQMVSELATYVDSPLATVSAEIARLADSGIVESRRVGPARIIKANKNYPLLRPLTQIAVTLYGPPALVRDEFAGIAGVEQVSIFGSWAARATGQPGPAPQDLDVLVIGDPDFSEVFAAASRVQDHTQMPVNPQILTRAEWESVTGFTATLRSQPMIEVHNAAITSTGP